MSMKNANRIKALSIGVGCYFIYSQLHILPFMEINNFVNPYEMNGQHMLRIIYTLYP